MPFPVEQSVQSRGSDHTEHTPHAIGDALTDSLGEDHLAAGAQQELEAPAGAWDPGSMGDGSGARKKGDRVLQHSMRASTQGGSHYRAGGRAQRDWKMSLDAGYGTQQYHDGESRGRTHRKTGTLKKGFTKTESSEAYTRSGETTVERHVHEKTGGDERWTTQKEYSGRDGTSSVQREVEQVDWDGRERELSETSYSGKKHGRYTVDDGDDDASASSYRVGDKAPLKDRIKDGLRGAGETLKSLPETVSDKIKGKKKARDVKKKGPQQAQGKSAWDEGDADAVRQKHSAVSTLLRHAKAGPIGDESSIDFEAFEAKPEDTSRAFESGSRTEDIDGGTKNALTAGLGAAMSGSTQSTQRTTNSRGQEEVTTAGATGGITAGLKAALSAYEKQTADGTVRGVDASASAGAEAKGAAGITHQVNLGGGLTGESGAVAEGELFAGARASGGASVTSSSSSVAASANAEAMVGAEAEASAGASSALRGGGFDLAGARAKADGRALAGAKASGSGEAKASLSSGASASGSAEAIAGAKAEGTAAAGVSAGGVDLDAVAQGEAEAGASASASGNASAGWTGIGVGGQAGAFAGAKAGGQVRAELGAGGLNFGLIGVSGEVSAGAGAEASGELYAQLHRTGAAGEVSAALGVGAGVGMVATVDPSFPVRLTLNKLAQNGILPSDDVGQLATSAFKGVYVPEKGGGRPVSLDAAASTIEERVHLKEASKVLQDRSKKAGKSAFGELKQATRAGGGLRDGILQAMSDAFGSTQSTVQAVGEGAKAIFARATTEAGALAGELQGVAGTVIAEIQALMAIDPRRLLELDWEAQLDALVARIHAAISDIEARVQALIERTRESVDRLIDTSVDAGTAPLSNLGRVLSGTVGRFGRRLAGLGRRMMKHLQGGVEFGEEGVPVEEMDGKVALPIKISDTFATGAQGLRVIESIGEDTVQGAVDKVSDTVTGGIKDGLKATNDGSAGTLSGEASATVKLAADAARLAVDGAAAGARHVILPAIKLVQKAIEAAKAAAAVAAKAVKTVTKAAKAVIGWFGGLFGW